MTAPTPVHLCCMPELGEKLRARVRVADEAFQGMHDVLVLCCCRGR